MPLKIRLETSSDYPEISRVNTLAFGQPAEANLVEKLRKNPKFIPELSLVAEMNGEIVGHILFFPISIKEGLKVARKLGFESVIVLGHPEYYPRFGFEAAGKWGIKDPFGAPAEAFMALELKEGSLEGAAGLVKYPEEFYGV